MKKSLSASSLSLAVASFSALVSLSCSVVPELDARLQARERTGAQSSAPSYTPVTDARLESPSPNDWLMYRRTYDSWGYSPLDQVTVDNVADLVPVWSFSTGVISGHQAPPQVNDGTMFVTTPESQVLALDARTGELLWRYVRQLPR